MKFTTRQDFPTILPTSKTLFCWECRSTNVAKTCDDNGNTCFICNDCHKQSPRVLIYDNNMQQHFDNQDRLVHESCGMFLKNSKGQILLFKRVKYPYLLTIPAGHLEIEEKPIDCAIRETYEEIGIKTTNPELVFCDNIEGDSCLGGADIHHWSAYIVQINEDVNVKLDEEGSDWGWYNVSDLNTSNTVQPVLIILANANVIKSLSK